jgi:hypothetical protein
MVGGIVASIMVFRVGAILDFAITESPYQHGFDLHTVGVILMILGAVGFVLSLCAFAFGGSGWRRHRTIVDDGQGNVARREDTYL